MATLARLYDFTPGDTIRSAEVDAEYDQIIDLLNGTSTSVQTYLQLNDVALPTLKVNQTVTNAGATILSLLANGVEKVKVDGVGKIHSTVATGTMPFTIASTTMSTNLNADLLDGYHASEIIAAAATGDIETLTLIGDTPAVIFNDSDVANTGWAQISMLNDGVDQQLTLVRVSDSQKIQRWNISQGTVQFHNVAVLRKDNGDDVDITVAVGGSDPDQHLTPKLYVDDADDVVLAAAMAYTDLVAGTSLEAIYDPAKHLLTRNYVVPSATTLTVADGMAGGVSVVGTSSHSSGASGMFAVQTTNAAATARGEFMSTATMPQFRWGAGEWAARIIVAPTGDVTDLQMLIGLVLSDISNPASGTPTADYAMFRYDTAIDGTAFWRCASDNSTGTPEATTTAVAITANTLYRLRIRWNAAATEFKFYIDDVLVATHSTKVPGNSTLVRWCALQKTLAAEAKSLGIQWVQWWS
jgi:hypothetical protein